MILPDANLLLYAYDASSPFHPKASRWWANCLNGNQPIGLCSPVLFAFVRIGTSPRAFSNPMTIATAAKHVQSWLAQPIADWIEMQPGDIEVTLNLLREAGTGGNLTTDAQIAALSLRLKATIHSADADFSRFAKVAWKNPLLKK